MSSDAAAAAPSAMAEQQQAPNVSVASSIRSREAAKQDGTCSWIKQTLYDLLSHIVMPSELVLVNIRLGILFKILQLISIVAGVYVAWNSRFKVYAPLDVDLTFWDEPIAKEKDATVAHCATPEMFAYSDDTYQYNPSKCKALASGESYVKSMKSMFYPLFVEEVITRSKTGGADCTALQTECTSAGGEYAIDEADPNECHCKHKDEFFVQNSEKQTMALRHQYKVRRSFQSGIYEWGTSSADTYEHGTETDRTVVEGVMKTRLLKEDGTPCKVGGKSEWLSGEGDMMLSVEDLVKCGDLALDSRINELAANGGDAPYLRLSGASITLEFRYTNSDPDQGNHFTVCDVIVQATPMWNQRTHIDFLQFDEEQGAEHIFMMSNGVTIQFSDGGTFNRLDPSAMITGIVQAVVLIGVPVQIMRILAIYGVGLVSSIYVFALRQRFSIFEQFHGMAARTMISSVGFRAITNQWDAPVAELKPLTIDEVESRMLECFHRDISLGNVKSEEVKVLAQVTLAGLDAEDDMSVSHEEFVKALGGNNIMDTETMVNFFDEQRRVNCLQRLFDPTQAEIKAARERLPKKDGEDLTQDRGPTSAGMASVVADALS